MIPTDTFADALNEQLSIHLGLALIHEDKQQFIDGMSDFLEHEAQRASNLEGMRSLLPILFSILPKSLNHFSFQSIKLPKRNDSCLCGSGKKLKKCCPQILEMPAPQPAQLFTLALNGLSENAFNLLAQKPNWNLKAATLFIPFACRSDCFEAALLVAEPFCKNLAVLRNEHQEFISCVFDLLFDLGEDAVRLPLLQEVSELKQAPSLQSIAHQRLAMIHSQKGEVDKSQHHLQQAFRCDPNQDELALAELSILGMIAEEDELKARAKFWQVRLLKKYDDHPALDLIEDVLENGKKFFENHREMMELENDNDSRMLFDNSADEVIQQQHAEHLLAALLSNELTQTIYDIKIADGEAKLSLAKQLKPLYKQWLALYEASGKNINPAYGAVSENLDDTIDSQRWNMSPPEWLIFLHQYPILFSSLEVNNRLASHIYQAPIPHEDDDLVEDADYNDELSLAKLSVFSQLIIAFKKKNSSNLLEIMAVLPKDTQLPHRFKGNQCFWRLAHEHHIELNEKLELEEQQIFLQQLNALDKKTPTWLVNSLLLSYFQQGKGDQIITVFKTFKNPTLSMIIIAAHAYKEKGDNHTAIRLFADIKGKNKKLLIHFQKTLQTEEFEPSLSEALESGLLLLAHEIMKALEAMEDNYLPASMNGNYIQQCYYWLLEHLPKK